MCPTTTEASIVSHMAHLTQLITALQYNATNSVSYNQVGLSSPSTPSLPQLVMSSLYTSHNGYDNNNNMNKNSSYDDTSIRALAISSLIISLLCMFTIVFFIRKFFQCNKNKDDFSTSLHL